MTTVQEITDVLGEFEELRGVLDDLNVKYVTIAANGHWSFEKLGRTRHGSEPLPPELMRHLSQRIPAGRHARSGEWAVRKYDGVAGASLLIERLPIAVADRLPQEVLSTLKRQVRADGNGLLVGQPGAGKGALLLWLALQIPDRPVLYVAENPPSEFPGNHIMHVYPPSTPQERRALERFVRLSPTVMWDRVANAADLTTLFGFPGAHRRWFTLDSSSVRSALRLLTGAVVNGCDTRFSTLLALTSSVIGRPEAQNLLVRDGGVWVEEYESDASCLDLLEAYEATDLRRLGPTEVSTPGTLLADVGKVEVAADFALEAESVAEPVRTERGVPPSPEAAGEEPESAETPPDDERVAPSPSEDNPRTVPVELADVDLDEPAEAITGMLPKDEIRELRDKREARRSDELEASSREDLPAAEPSVPEVTKTYADHGGGIEEDYLAAVVPEIDSDEPESVPDINLDDLRITTTGDPSDADLAFEHEVQSDEEYDASEDLSGVFEGDLDFDDLAEEMLSEISEVEAELIEEPRHFGETNPEQRIYLSDEDLEIVEPDELIEDSDGDQTIAARADILSLAKAMGDAPGSVVDTGESTREFTMKERVLETKKSQNDD